MEKETVRKRSKLPIIIAAVLVVIIAAAAVFFILKPKTAPVDDLKPQLGAMMKEAKKSIDGGVIPQAAADAMKIELVGESDISFRSAKQEVKVSYLDVEALTAGLESEMQEKMETYVANAFHKNEVFDENDNFLDSQVDAAYSSAITARLKNRNDYIRSENVTLNLKYSDGRWNIENVSDVESLLVISPDKRPNYEALKAKLQPIDFHYTLNDRTSPGPKPDASKFGKTTDPKVISDMLETETAKKLIKGQSLDWNADKAFLPGSTISYYMDETILVIVWQEVEHGAIGTFSEVFLADASQLRRKIAGDIFGCYEFYVPTELAAQANAVAAVSGDFYDREDKAWGVYCYDGVVMHAGLNDAQTCYFTDKGDMIFTREGQFASNQEAQKFCDENNVMFSVSFGPILIDDGKIVCPEYYQLGQINDTYARCAIAQLGELHYLAATVNVRVPDYNVYITEMQMAETMLKHGCPKAYGLDGGQTGSIVLGNELMNPVQFGEQRRISDIIYFATAIPND